MTDTSLPWEADIAAYQKADRENPPEPGGIVFVGSSSITFWFSLLRDFEGWPVIGRGFGGSLLEDSVRYADRIVIPYRPRQVVLFAGENDLDQGGKTPEAVFVDFGAFVGKIHAALPQTIIAYLAVKPSPARRHLFGAFRETNRLIEAFTQADPRLQFIDTWTPMLDASGEPSLEFWTSDGVHLSRRGYMCWVEAIRPFLKSSQT